MNEKEIIGRQLQQYREEKCFTQGLVAEKSCISINYLASIEREFLFQESRYYYVFLKR